MPIAKNHTAGGAGVEKGSHRPLSGSCLTRARNARYFSIFKVLAFVSALVGGLALGLCPVAAQEAKTGKVSGLKIPRFVSLKASRVNLRKGPGTDYPTAWVFRRIGLPVEVIEEFDSWRQIRDAEGATGWVFHSLLSGRRTAQILPWEIKNGPQRPRTLLFSTKSERSGVVAKVEAGVVADILSCNGSWCHISVAQYNAYIQQNKLWGVYANEVLE